MKKLLKYLNEIGLKPTPWGEDNGISPAVMSRLLNGRRLSATNYLKISQATGGRVSVEELMGTN